MCFRNVNKRGLTSLTSNDILNSLPMHHTTTDLKSTLLIVLFYILFSQSSSIQFKYLLKPVPGVGCCFGCGFSCSVASNSHFYDLGTQFSCSSQTLFQIPRVLFDRGALCIYIPSCRISSCLELFRVNRLQLPEISKYPCQLEGR